MKVLGILQNSWFYDPPKIKRMLEQYVFDPEKQERLRRRLMSYALFAGCKTGRMLQATLGPQWCSAIVWENASKEIGDFSSSVFPADLFHIRRRIVQEEPAVVVGFGKVACNALEEFGPTGAFGLPLDPPPRFLEAPHPVARDSDTVEKLRDLRKVLDKINYTNEHTDRPLTRAAS